jgi:hypothetical protein
MGKAIKILFIGLGSVIALLLIISLAVVSTSKTPSGPLAVGPAVAAPVTQTATPPSPPPVAGPATTIGDGTYLIGTDAVAGTWKTAGPPADSIVGMCGWSRNKNADGDLASIITNGFQAGPSVAAVKNGEYFTVTGGCVWAKK